MTYSLKDDTTKYWIIELDKDGKSQTEISAETGIGKSTVGDFLRRESFQSFWGNYEKEEEAVDIQEEQDVSDLCESSDWHVANLAKRLRTAQRTNTQLRRTLNKTTDIESHIPDMIRAVDIATKELNTKGFSTVPTPKPKSGKETICEVLLSDYQIGKVGQYYNSKLAEKAMKKFGGEVLEIASSTTHSKIVLALIGDLVEDHLKHGVQSAVATDSGLAEQIANAISHLWKYVVHPLASLGVNMEVVCIAGNHGSSQHKGMDMYKAGLYSYDYVIYKALEGYCGVAGYNHVQFIIPEGCFGYTDIFGRYAVYEHGYFNTSTEKSLEDQRNKRSNQLKRHVEYFRCGDMHHVCNFDNGKLVVNGAFFGVDTTGEEYSGILGFSSIPAQVVFVHEDDKSIGRNTIKQTYVIQVADGY